MHVIEVEMEVVERLLDKTVDLRAKYPADDEAGSCVCDGVNEALAQFFQVLHQAHAG
jgi:hypothetical protein